MGHDDQSGRPAAPRPVLDFLTLEQAAGELGASPQGVVQLLHQGAIEIRRMERGGRTLSGISRVELERLRAALETPQGGEPETLRQRLLEAEAALEVARTESELAREAFERLARVTTEAEAAERRVGELRAEQQRLAAELAEARARLAAQDARAAEQELLWSAERTAAERTLAREREVTEAARAARRAVELRLADELNRSNRLRGQLQRAGELEAANERFLDQLEQKLAAANHTIVHLRRRPA